MKTMNLEKIWPDWTIEKEIGKGSYGTVYKAVRRYHDMESYSAIKVISIPSDSTEVETLRYEGMNSDETKAYFQAVVDDFVKEIQMMETLKGNQNIVSVEDYKVIEKTDSFGWDIFIRMEMLTPLNVYLSDKKLTESDVINLGRDICSALEICEKKGIIHRDIKPENIFVNDFGYYKLGDFGIARRLENVSGGLSQKGTFNYMAPEVVNSLNYDARVDIYSLGLVLYKLLNNNRLPFLDTEKQLLSPNERRSAVERRIRGEELPAPCNASEPMAQVILRACASEPWRRYTNPSQMKEELLNVRKTMDRELNLNDEEDKKKKKRKTALIVILILLWLVLMISVLVVRFTINVVQKTKEAVIDNIPSYVTLESSKQDAFIENNADEEKYQKAKELLENGDYIAAQDIFLELGDYRNSAILIKGCAYEHARQLVNEGKYDTAGPYFVIAISDDEWLQLHFGAMNEEIATDESSYISVIGEVVIHERHRYWKNGGAEIVLDYIDDDEIMDSFTYRATDPVTNEYVGWVEYDGKGNYLSE